MKKLIVSLSIILLLSIPDASAQRSRCRRVQFQPGQNTAVLRGAVRARQLFCYTLRAREGQRMSVRVTSPRNNVRLTIEPDVEQDTDPLYGGYDVAEWEMNLPADGNYRIMVWVPRGSSTFNLSVTIQ